LINNTRTDYQFAFTKIFKEDVGQEEIFNAVALPVIQEAFQGYNGTIFAYG
jgi:kinesin family protein 6/9